MCKFRSLLPAVLIGVCEAQRVVSAGQTNAVASVRAYTVPPEFPSSVFSQYYYGAAPTEQPQPRIYDEVLNYTYPLELTDPTTIPEENDDVHVYPDSIAQFSNSNSTALIAEARIQIAGILSSSSSNCTKCIDVLEVGQYLARRIPSMVPDLLVELCQSVGLASNTSCRDSYSGASFGSIWTQVLALGNVTGSDGQYVCHHLSTRYCPRPYTLPTNTSAYFGPKPGDVTVPQASGQRVKVLHLSDLHLDPRFAVGQEANCAASMCCRYPGPGNMFTNVSTPATTYGNFKCDSPYYLATAALSSVQPLTGTTSNYSNSSLTDHFAWSLYTGDLASHDPEPQLSRNYTMYAEWSVYHMMKSFIPGGPVFVTLGNHDSTPTSIDAAHSLPGPLGEQQSWNYDHVASLWQHNGWISEDDAKLARSHYAGYSINHPKYPKLRIISLNADFWYSSNLLNYINTTDPDNSGTLSFLAQELQEAEDNGERVWIIGHVLTGWDGTNPLQNPTDAFYQIVDRYSPHVIAAIFFGHTHEDEFMIFYSNNGTSQNRSTAQSVGWIGPSLTPLTNLNSGYRMYEVDTGDFNVYNAYTYYSNVSAYNEIDTSQSGPVFELEYSTRDTYAIDWPADAPLNATYWHLVTEAMEQNRTLVSIHNTFQGKSSVRSQNCTSDACAAAKICYMRSGSAALGSQCPQGFGSVQSAFTGKDF